MLMHIREENENQCMRNWLQIILISSQLSNKWDSFVITTVSVTHVIRVLIFVWIFCVYTVHSFNFLYLRKGHRVC